MSQPKITMIQQFNELRKKREEKKKDTPKGPVNLKALREELKSAQARFRKP